MFREYAQHDDLATPFSEQLQGTWSGATQITPGATLRLATAQPATTQPVTTQPATQPAAAPDPLPSLTLKQALQQAIDQQKPVLLILGAEWCGPCRLLEREIDKPEARLALQKWVYVHLDIDKSDEAREMGVNAVPELRILASDGTVVAREVGFRTAARLIDWLGQHQAAAGASAIPELAATGQPDAAALASIVQRLADAQPAIREAAIRRLLPFPGISAEPVAKAFQTGTLAIRLSSLELLSAWRAPLDGLDPWQPKTFTPERLARLKQWAGAVPRSPATQPAALTADQLRQIRPDLDRLAASDSATEAQAIIERLSRFGSALLPEVYSNIAKTSTDEQRQRLTHLRYRLVASNTLALQWPGGIERLASLDARTRNAAAHELARRAGPADAALLLELFSDPDALVRELSLRALQAVGGPEASTSLLRLLDDPSPNVRAAVLKQFAESPPDRTAILSVGQYAQKETDADLVVHAVRVLRGSANTSAVPALTKLLEHSNWRVRAESVEALQEIAGNRSQASAASQADHYAAMIRLLDDPDAFVVSRAAMSLQNADTPLRIQPLLKAAEKHPQLAREIVKSISGRDARSQTTITQLRKMLAHPSPLVRAAAIGGLAEMEPGPEFKSVLQDPDASVRVAAARALAEALHALLPSENQDYSRPQPSFLGGLFGGGRAAPKPSDPNEWVDQFRAGKERPVWADACKELVLKMLNAATPLERGAAAIPLIALGAEDKARPVLLDAAKADTDVGLFAHEAIPWLPRTQRPDFFRKLSAVAPGKASSAIIQSMARIPDPAAADALWGVLAEAGGADIASYIHDALRTIYTGRRYGLPNNFSDEQRKAAVAVIAPRAQAGSPHQRVVALALLLDISPADAAEDAARLSRDASLPPDLRLDAYRALMLAGPTETATMTAVQTLGGTDAAFKVTALAYLAGDSDNISDWPGRFTLGSGSVRVFNSGSNAVDLAPPAGLKAEHISSFLHDGDTDSASRAAYLLALLGERRGVDVLVAQWQREKQHKDHDMQRRIYRAIAAIGDTEYVPVLEEIYASLKDERYYIREFYWTIRSLKGERALLLRKKIRDEIGMDELR
jgi:HEAT repeat protein/thiol-disulfide isomerase/thioredoxin